MIVAIKFPGSNMRRQFERIPLQFGSDEKAVPLNPIQPITPHATQESITRKQPRKRSLGIFSGYFAFLTIGKVMLCRQNAPQRIPKSGPIFLLNSFICQVPFYKGDNGESENTKVVFPKLYIPIATRKISVMNTKTTEQVLILTNKSSLLIRVSAIRINMMMIQMYV